MWPDIFISALGAFVGILGAYWIYYIQIRNQHKDKLIYCVTLLDSVLPFIQALSVHCAELADEISAKPTHAHLLKIQANSDLKRLSEKFDQESFLHSFLWKYGRKNQTYKSFKKIYSSIDFLDHSVDQLKDYLQKEYESITKKKRSYAEYLEEGIEKIALLTVNHSLQDEKILMQFLNEMLINYYGNREDLENLDYPLNSFLLPIQDYLAKNFQTNPETNNALVTIKRAINAYTSFEMQAKALSEDIKSYGVSLRRLMNSLQVDTQQIRNDFKIQ